MILLQAIFWFSLFLIFHTYILFPSILQLLAPAKKQKNTDNLQDNPDTPEKLPFLSVLIAAFNEEEVIEAKIRSVLQSDYPADKLEIWVGSDNSTDRTNEILSELEKENSLVRVRIFEERTGKPDVINQLADNLPWSH